MLSTRSSIDVPTSGRPPPTLANCNYDDTDNAYHDEGRRRRRGPPTKQSRRRGSNSMHQLLLLVALQYLIFISAISGHPFPAEHFKGTTTTTTRRSVQGSSELPGTFNGTQAIITTHADTQSSAKQLPVISIVDDREHKGGAEGQIPVGTREDEWGVDSLNLLEAFAGNERRRWQINHTSVIKRITIRPPAKTSDRSGNSFHGQLISKRPVIAIGQTQSKRRLLIESLPQHKPSKEDAKGKHEDEAKTNMDGNPLEESIFTGLNAAQVQQTLLLLYSATQSEENPFRSPSSSLRQYNRRSHEAETANQQLSDQPPSSPLPPAELMKSARDAWIKDWRMLPISDKAELYNLPGMVHYFRGHTKTMRRNWNSVATAWEDFVEKVSSVESRQQNQEAHFVLWCPWHDVIIVGCSSSVVNKLTEPDNRMVARTMNSSTGSSVSSAGEGPYLVNTIPACSATAAAAATEPVVGETKSNLGFGPDVEAVKLLTSLSLSAAADEVNICGISTRLSGTSQMVGEDLQQGLPGRKHTRKRRRRQSIGDATAAGAQDEGDSDVDVISNGKSDDTPPSGGVLEDGTEDGERKIIKENQIPGNDKTVGNDKVVALTDEGVLGKSRSTSGVVGDKFAGKLSDGISDGVVQESETVDTQSGGGMLSSPAKTEERYKFSTVESIQGEEPLHSTTSTLETTSVSSHSTSHRINQVFENTRGRGRWATRAPLRRYHGRGRTTTTTKTTGGSNYPVDGNGAVQRAGTVSVLGLFELSTRSGMRPEGHSELAAAQMAIKHINDRSLLPGYTLELLTNDTQCDPGVGVDRFFHALYTQHSTRMVMLLGSACSEVTESLAKVVPFWNIVQVSFGSTSPALSDRREFPLFYRTVAPDSSHNPARIAFIRRFGWDTVTTFTQNEEVHSLAVNDLVTELESANIKCAATITFAETDFKEQLLMLRELDTRIIIGSFSHEVAPKIFCEAYKLGMYGADYAWILHETMGPPWWQQSLAECSQWELEQAVENLIIVSSHNSIVGGESSISGLTNDMFRTELHSKAISHPMSPYAPQTYDAVWAMALALRGAEERWRNGNAPRVAEDKSGVKLDLFDYTRHDMAAEFLRQFSQLSFMGISGPVSFEGPDRVGTSVFHQIQGSVLKPIALYYPAPQHLDFDCRECRHIKWKSGQVPIAKRVFKFRYSTIAPVAFYTMTSLACVGISVALTFLAFNLHFRKLKTIKLSSPKLSNITLVGCILVYAAVILLGLDHSTLPATQSAFSTVCTARVYLLSAGFSLAFGSMFAKTYRVHRIFTHSGGGAVCKDKMLQDTQLISLVCALLLLDGLVVTLWVVADPMERHLSNLSLEISAIDRSVAYQPQVEVCRSQHTQSWLGALYAYKGLLLIVGVYMAWETRHVKIPALNDSQYIGVSVYLVVITSAIVVVLANLISERVTLAFITISALILTSTTATLCLLFLPKLHDIWHKLPDPVIHTMGLKMECNTRRFVTDDRRELQYRVEVQNRVYKKEVAALDAEIQKLERLLEQPPLSSTSSAVDLGRHIKTELSFVNEHHHHHNQSTLGNNNHSGSCCSHSNNKGRTPSIGGGLPLLLLSVLPPVIPRASWPSANPTQAPMRHSVTFSSQPHLDEPCGSTTVRLPAIDLLNLRLTHQQATAERSGLLNKLRTLFVTSRKQSTTSIAGCGGGGGGGLTTSTGIAAALKAHMGLLSGLVPSGGGGSTASCNALNTTTTSSAKGAGLRRMSLAKSGTAINATVEIVEPSLFVRQRHRKISTALMLSAANSLFGGGGTGAATEEEEDWTGGVDEVTGNVEEVLRVNFQLPANRRPSILNTTSQPPTLRERVKGSPRFPHRIMPTSSLSALAERECCNGSSLNLEETDRRCQVQTQMSSKWKSMEESTFHQHASPTEPPPPQAGVVGECAAVMSYGNQDACEETMVTRQQRMQQQLATNVGIVNGSEKKEQPDVVRVEMSRIRTGPVQEGNDGEVVEKSGTSGSAEFTSAEGSSRHQRSIVLSVVKLEAEEEGEETKIEGA